MAYLQKEESHFCSCAHSLLTLYISVFKELTLCLKRHRPYKDNPIDIKNIFYF